MFVFLGFSCGFGFPTLGMHLKASFVLRCAILVGIRGGLYDGFGAALGLDMYQRASVLGFGFADGFCNTCRYSICVSVFGFGLAIPSVCGLGV